MNQNRKIRGASVAGYNKQNIPTFSEFDISEWTSSASSFLASIAQQIQQLPQPPVDETASVLAGLATFGSTLAVSTWTQGKLLHISTGTPGPVPSLIGFGTVCIASLASHHMAISVHEFMHKHHNTRTNSIDWQLMSQSLQSRLKEKQQKLQNKDFQGFFRGNTRKKKKHEEMIDFKGLFHVPVNTIRICFVGLLAFKLLGGRFWAIAPSSYTHVGSFSRSHASLPATERYATASERVAMERLGRKWGCHTCGNHMLRLKSPPRFVGDHMPPKAVAEQMNSRWYRKWFGRKVTYRFYPQCITCSSKQGSILSKATQEMRSQFAAAGGKRALFNNKIPDLSQAGGGANAYIHGFRPRINHLTGGVLASIAVVGITPSQIRQTQGMERYELWHVQTEDWILRRYLNLKRSWLNRKK